MRYEELLRRLDDLPEPLPPPAAVPMPVLVGGEELPRSRTPPGGRAGRPAAVLVLLYPDEIGVARVVLTERASRDGHHSGEVSFPGGKAEPEDPDPAATALREAPRRSVSTRRQRVFGSSGGSSGSGSRSAISR